MFKREFSITVQLWHVYAAAPVNTQNYLAMSQIIELITGIQILWSKWKFVIKEVWGQEWIRFKGADMTTSAFLVWKKPFGFY